MRSLLTVIADSAMLSDANIESLKKNLSTRPLATTWISFALRVQDIVKHKNTDHASCIPHKNSSLICDFSSKRYAKDKYETENMYKKHMISLKKMAVNDINFFQVSRRICDQSATYRPDNTCGN